MEASGRFWLPTSPSESHWGNLEYEPGAGTRLVLEGALGQISYGPPVDFAELHGELFDGTPCVLRAAWAQVEVFSGKSEVPRTQVYAEAFSLGMTPSESTTDLFAELVVTFSHLNEWIGAPLDVDYADSNFANCEVHFSPEQLSVDLVHEEAPFKLRLFCGRSIPVAASSGELKFTYEYKLCVVPRDQQTLSWFLEVVAVLRQLLMFVIGNGVFTLELTLMPSAEPQSNIVQLYPVVGVPAVVRLENHYFNTQFRNIREWFPAAAHAWFTKSVELEVTRDAIGNLLLVDGIAAEGVFLRIAQALEHFHGVAFPAEAKYVQRATWRRVLKWLKSGLDTIWPDDSTCERSKLSSHWNVLTERIGNSNDLSFQSRLEQLCRSMPDHDLMPLLGNPRTLEEGLKGFVSRVAATRHYLTHFDDEQRAKAFPLNDLEKPTLQCWGLLHAVVARYLGLDDRFANDLALGAMHAEFFIGRNTRL